MRRHEWTNGLVAAVANEVCGGAQTVIATAWTSSHGPATAYPATVRSRLDGTAIVVLLQARSQSHRHRRSNANCAAISVRRPLTFWYSTEYGIHNTVASIKCLHLLAPVRNRDQHSPVIVDQSVRCQSP